MSDENIFDLRVAGAANKVMEAQDELRRATEQRDHVFKLFEPIKNYSNDDLELLMQLIRSKLGYDPNG